LHGLVRRPPCALLRSGPIAPTRARCATRTGQRRWPPLLCELLLDELECELLLDELECELLLLGELPCEPPDQPLECDGDEDGGLV
jgi:hypothetical protein